MSTTVIFTTLVSLLMTSASAQLMQKQAFSLSDLIRIPDSINFAMNDTLFTMEQAHPSTDGKLVQGIRVNSSAIESFFVDVMSYLGLNTNAIQKNKMEANLVLDSSILKELLDIQQILNTLNETAGWKKQKAYDLATGKAESVQALLESFAAAKGINTTDGTAVANTKVALNELVGFSNDKVSGRSLPNGFNKTDTINLFSKFIDEQMALINESKTSKLNFLGTHFDKGIGMNDSLVKIHDLKDRVDQFVTSVTQSLITCYEDVIPAPIETVIPAPI